MYDHLQSVIELAKEKGALEVTNAFNPDSIILIFENKPPSHFEASAEGSIKAIEFLEKM